MIMSKVEISILLTFLIFLGTLAIAIYKESKNNDFMG